MGDLFWVGGVMASKDERRRRWKDKENRECKVEERY